MNGVPMYWNLVLDCVTFICIAKKSWDTTGNLPMNWNWVLDWVTSDGTWTKWSSGFMNGYIHIQWKQSEDNTSKVPMNWNWVLDWVISDGSWTKWPSGFMNGVPMYWNLALDWVTFIYIEKNHRTPLARYPWIGIWYWIGLHLYMLIKKS